MAGTIPLSNHVPLNDPITRSIRIAPIADPMLFTILSSISFQEYPNLHEIIPATAAPKIKAIWFGPDVASESKTITFDPNRIIKIRIGKRARPKLGDFFSFIYESLTLKLSR